MAQVTITVPDDQVARILTALGYNVGGGLTAAQFIKGWIINEVKTAVTVAERKSLVFQAGQLIVTAERQIIVPPDVT